jgi:hypothetical protein
MIPAIPGVRDHRRVLLEEVAQALYGLVPGEFTAERDARAREAKAAGDRDLATRIRALGRPTVVAWLANQLARRLPEEIEALLELGEEMRAATAARQGAELRELSGRQQRAIRDLTRRAADLAAEAAQPVSAATARALDDTLRAAVADPVLGEQLRLGTLSGGLSPVGFLGGFDIGEPEPSASATTETDQAAQRIAQAEAAAREAAERLRSAQAALDAATENEARLADREAQLRRELHAVEKERKLLQDSKNQARKELDRAIETARHLAL